MYKLLQLSVREAVRDAVRVRSCRRVSLSVSGLSDRQRRAEQTDRRVSNQQLCRETWRRSACRFYSSRRGEREPSFSSTVDPNQEEQFVFLDCAEPEPEPEPEPEDQKNLLPPSAPAEQDRSAPRSARSESEKQHRALERQLKVLSAAAQQEAEPDDLIQFHDTDFPPDPSIVSTSKKKKKKKGSGQQKIYGTPDVDEPVSATCCSGCGAALHCTAAAVPGYLPSEKYKTLLRDGRLRSATCQRCFLLTHHRQALSVSMSKDQYRDVVRRIKSQKALVLLVVDLLDVPDSIVPDLPELVGTNKRVVVLGNKVDLLPGDSAGYLQRVRRQLTRYCADAGLGRQVRDVQLISAKTGYGIENLISSLQRAWGYKGDVYLVGTANAGKSTLFNTLLESDFCKSKAADVIQKATISPWPGTTLNLLKFPIINPTPQRLQRRSERLRQTEEELPPDQLSRLQHLRRQGYLVGRVGRTFRVESGSRSDVIQFDPDSLAYGEYEAGEEAKEASSLLTEAEFSHNELKDARWLFDTPGIMKERDVLSLLTEQEVRLLVPTQAIVPRTFVLKPGSTLFLGALGRIDFLQGEKSCWFSVVASSRLPVHITGLEKADAVYQKHAGHALLGVPVGGAERMQQFPALVSQDFSLEGLGFLQAAADIKLSSAGWVAVTAVEGEQLRLRVHGPEAAGFCLRTPPLLPHIVALKGQRIRKSSAYKPVKPAALLDLQVKKTKKKKKST
ncbi:nitric oxide-associated protein 1 [Centroberyx gerrardi]